MGTPNLARDSAGKERNCSSPYLPELLHASLQGYCKQQKPFGNLPEASDNLFLVFVNLSEALVNLLEAFVKLTKGSNKLLSCSDRLPKLLFCFKTAFFFLPAPLIVELHYKKGV